MNWKDCIHRDYLYGTGDRFTWPEAGWNGFDCNTEAFTISDVWGAVAWVWTFPGDWLLSLAPIRTFFEIDTPAAVGAWGSVALGFPVYVLGTGFILVACETIIERFSGSPL